MNNIKQYKLNGRLTMSDEKYNYVVVDGNKEINLTDIFDGILARDYINRLTTILTLVIELNGRVSFKEEGQLKMRQDEVGVRSYFLGGENLDKFLFYHTGEYMNVYIKTTEM